jgi:hypothetical protein
MQASSSESLPHWDLSNVYAGLESDEFRRDLYRLKLQLADLDRYLSDQRISRTGLRLPDSSRLAHVISGYLTRRNRTLRLYRTLLSYIYSFVTTDSYNTTAKRAMSELDALRVRLERQEVLFQGWLLFGLGLYAIYQRRGAGFLPEYDALLSSTGEATAVDLAARFGIDLRQPVFWEGSLCVIEARIERYLAL